MSSTPAARKPLPVSDPVTAPFWASVKARALEVQRCDDCGNYFFYPRGLCPHCFSRNLTWTRVSGRGTVYAFTIVYRHPNPAFGGEAPYVVALIELEEGVRLLSNLVGVAPDPAEVQIGLPVEVVYEEASADVTLPKFRPRR